MLSGYVTARIAIVHIPDITGDVLLQNHDVSGSNRCHSRSRGGPWEAPPVGGKI